MTTRTTGATTDPPPRARGFAQFSVRTRITVSIALLTTLAMAAAGLLVHALESARIERAVNEQIDQEAAEFRQLQGGNDPETAEPFTDVARLLTTFLKRNVPDDDEMLVAHYGGKEQDRTRNRYGEQFLNDAAYERAVADRLDRGGTATIRSEEFGEVWVTVLPVRNDASRGALIIINFLDDEHAELNRTLQTYGIVALLSLGIITVLAAFQSGRLLSPLHTLQETADQMTASDLSRRIPERGNDDITALTRTINHMLDRLESAFTTQREFLDDAGHELKTPLTVLRGHLELLDQGSPEDIAETRALLLDEVDRMSGLVNSLILLAKTNRPDFLSPTAVSLERFTATVLAKARGLGERDWQSDGSGEGAVFVDEQRLTQALLALADNAVKHTRIGDVVALGSSYDDGWVRFWVRDTGAGIRAEDRDVIFERFGRSRVSPDDEGFGLGLSIVRAIAEVHGGTVHVEDAQPTGSRFVITLPDSPRLGTPKETSWPAS